MIKKIVLTIMLGIALSSLGFAQDFNQESEFEPEFNAGATESDRDGMEYNQPADIQGANESGQEAREKSAKVDDENNSSIKTQYRNGRMTQWQMYDNKGRLASQIYYKSDRPMMIRIYDSQGKPRHGEYKALYPNGKPRIVEHYRDGVQMVRNGYYENGQLRYEMKKKKDGMRAKFREYTEDGKIKDGEYKEFYPSGRIKGMGHFRKGMPEGNFVSFCENGKVVAEKQFKKGRLVSQSWEKNGNGTPICEDGFSYLTNGAATVVSMSVN